MPTTRYVLRRPHRGELSHTQELELWLGASHHGLAFDSNEQRRAAWFRHRDRLMRWFAKNGRRPEGWWRYEAPEGLRYPGYDRERSVLYQAGVLGEEEARELQDWWRKEFDRSWDPHFFFCAGPGKIFTGAVARQKHYLWADLPAELCEKWTAERHQCSQAIRELESPAEG
jgi:hypothetical protein